MLADFLAVDPSRPYVEHGSFLEIERAARAGQLHQTCGGRSLNDDVMDTLFTLWVNGGNGPRIRDGVDRATEPCDGRLPLPGGSESRSAPTSGPSVRTEGLMSELRSGPTAGLELDDIQYGALHQRPSPYVATYLLVRVDDREAGRELLRRISPAG